MNKYIDLDHIGKILQEEFMEPYKLSQNALAKAIGVVPSRITDIVNGRRAVTADTDLRLTRLFGLSEGYFLRIQEHIETTLARQKIERELARIVPLKERSA
jgi:addiction module HigA family antidote